MDDNPFVAEYPPGVAGVAWITKKSRDICEKLTAHIADCSICFCSATVSSRSASFFIQAPRPQNQRQSSVLPAD